MRMAAAPGTRADATNWFRASRKKEDQSMRLHIDKDGTNHERINLIMLIALFLIVGSAIFYLGQSFVVPSQPAGFFGPISSF
jgi:hypothetical protein